jgi:hypothetical protein
MRKLFVTLMATAILSLMLVYPVAANGAVVYVDFNKRQYAPGEQGTFSITIRNTGDSPIEVKNVSVVFDNWMMYTVDGWDELGNQTIDYSDLAPIGSNKTAALEDVSFTVPTDGRAMSTNVHIRVYTDKQVLTPQATPYIDVVGPEALNIQRSMDNIVTLLTLVAILAIISAIIIAAAVFLSGRRPAGATWQKED